MSGAPTFYENIHTTHTSLKHKK